VVCLSRQTRTGDAVAGPRGQLCRRWPTDRDRSCLSQASVYINRVWQKRILLDGLVIVWNFVFVCIRIRTNSVIRTNTNS